MHMKGASRAEEVGAHVLENSQGFGKEREGIAAWAEETGELEEGKPQWQWGQKYAHRALWGPSCCREDRVSDVTRCYQYWPSN